MAAVEKPYITKLHRNKGDVYRIRIWDPILSKHESKTVMPPAGMSGKKLDVWLSKEIESMENHVKYRTSVTAPGTPFGEFFLGEWYKEASKTNEEAGMYEYVQTYNRHLKDTLGPVPLDKIVPRTIDVAYDAMKAKGLSDDFVYRVNKLVCQVLGEAKRRGIIDVNVPREKMRAPRRSPKNPFDDQKALEPDDIFRIIECLGEEPLEWRALIYVLIITGMRRGEVCGLTWDSIDFAKGRISITKSVRRVPHKGVTIKCPKTPTAFRQVYMTPDLTTLLSEYKAVSSMSNKEFVFKGRGNPNEPMHPDSVTAHISDFSKKCGVAFSPQDLRSTFVSTLIAILDIDPRTAQDVVGHSSIDVTMGIYARSREGSRRAAQQAFEDYIRGKCSGAMDTLTEAADEA